MAKIKGFPEMPTEHLKCRSLGHAWDPQRTVFIKEGRRRAYHTDLICLRCKTPGIDIVYVSDGDKKPRKYKYKGYLIEDAKSWGDRKTFNRNVRLELYGRLVEGK